MIDIHSHILPNVDDGSKSMEITLELLRMSADQGVDTIAATPHFYAWETEPEKFLSRRQKAYDQVMSLWEPGFPEIIPGAEVYYFEGISKSENLERLYLDRRKVLLLEMPFGQRWTDRMISDIYSLNRRPDTRVLLAHIERYMDQQKKDIWKDLRAHDVLMQCNATFFLDRKTRKKAIKMVQNREVDLIGSDCHSVDHRPPLCGQAAEAIRSALGEEPLQRMDKIGRQLLSDFRD